MPLRLVKQVKGEKGIASCRRDLTSLYLSILSCAILIIGPSVKPPRSEERGILIWMAELSIAYSPPFHPP